MPDDLTNINKKEGRAIISVNRPGKRNAMDVRTRKSLLDAFKEAEKDATIEAIILCGEGDTFISGSDITIFEDMDYTSAKEYTKYTQGLYNYIEDIPLPVIAAIDGYAMGGGLEISLCCDLRVASEDAMLGQSEINIGAIPGGGGTQRLPREIGLGNAKELMFTGEPIDAERAHGMGLVNRVVPNDQLMKECHKLCDKMLQHSPDILSVLKETINTGMKTDLQSGLELEKLAWASVFTSDDLTEGVSAFLENRDPEYEGRTITQLE